MPHTAPLFAQILSTSYLKWTYNHWLPPKAKINLANLAKVKKIPLAKSIFL